MKRAIEYTILALFLLHCRSAQPGDRLTPIENTYWKLTEVAGNTVTNPVGGKEVYMMLARDGRSGILKGYAGCNGLGGDFTVEGKHIEFQPITTRMYCEGQMETETLFTGMLTAADNYRIRGNILELLKENELLGKFTAKPQP